LWGGGEGSPRHTLPPRSRAGSGKVEEWRGVKWSRGLYDALTSSGSGDSGVTWERVPTTAADERWYETKGPAGWDARALTTTGWGHAVAEQAMRVRHIKKDPAAGAAGASVSPHSAAQHTPPPPACRSRSRLHSGARRGDAPAARVVGHPPSASLGATHRPTAGPLPGVDAPLHRQPPRPPIFVRPAGRRRQTAGPARSSGGIRAAFERPVVGFARPAGANRRPEMAQRRLWVGSQPWRLPVTGCTKAELGCVPPPCGILPGRCESATRIAHVKYHLCRTK